MKIENAASVEVGRLYDVPCVYAAWHSYDPRWWVVHGSWHEDKQYLDFEDHHYHLDPRFVPHSVFNWVRPESVFALPIHERVGDCNFTNSDLSIIRKRRKCLREMPRVTRGGFTAALRDAFAGQRLIRGEICPHKGYSLKAIKPVDGCRQCPLHGLVFDEKGVCVR